MSIEIDIALPGRIGKPEYHHLTILRLEGREPTRRIYRYRATLGERSTEFLHYYEEGWVRCIERALTALREQT